MDPKYKIFVGHPFSFDKKVYRAAFRAVERKFPNVEFVFADETITTSNILSKIISMISDSEICIFDFTEWNPNVAMEYGIAVGSGKQGFIIFNPSKHGENKIPTDISGHDRLDYNNIKVLKENIIKIVVGQLGIGNQSVYTSVTAHFEDQLLIHLLQSAVPLSTTEISNHFKVPRGVVYSSLKTLEARGHVELKGAKRGSKWQAINKIVPRSASGPGLTLQAKGTVGKRKGPVRS